MSKRKYDFSKDLKLFIELSSGSSEYKKLFEKFHKTLISISHDATDIHIDYSQKRISMNVEVEDSKGHFLWRLDNSVPTEVCLDLDYENLCDFLIEGVEDKDAVLEPYYSLLKAKYHEGKSLYEKLRRLEEA
jgi:hypothetical protein